MVGTSNKSVPEMAIDMLSWSFRSPHPQSSWLVDHDPLLGGILAQVGHNGLQHFQGLQEIYPHVCLPTIYIDFHSKSSMDRF